MSSDGFSTFSVERPADADSNRTAITRVDLHVLHEFLRLPSSVSIVSVRPDPSSSMRCILDLRGPGIPEGTDEVVVHMTFRTWRLPTFDKFTVPSRD